MPRGRAFGAKSYTNLAALAGANEDYEGDKDLLGVGKLGKVGKISKFPGKNSKHFVNSLSSSNIYALLKQAEEAPELSNDLLNIGKDGVMDLKFTASVKGEWTATTSGGSMEYASWRHGLQYNLTVSGPPGSQAWVKIVMTQTEIEPSAKTTTTSPPPTSHPNGKNPRDIGLYVARREGIYAEQEKQRFRLVTFSHDDFVCVSQFSSDQPVSVESWLTPQAIPYVLLPVAATPGHIAKFELSVSSTSPVSISSLNDECNRWKHVRYDGEWGKRQLHSTMGGCRHHITWRNNPQYILRILRANTTLIISLSQETKVEDNEEGEELNTMGFYIAEKKTEPHQRKMVLRNVELVAKTLFAAHKQVHLELTIDPCQNGYRIIPSTYDNGRPGKYVLRVWSDYDLSLQPVNENWRHVSCDVPWLDCHLYRPQIEPALPLPGDKYFFVSRHTNKVLRCSSNGSVRCAGTDRSANQQWRILLEDSEAEGVRLANDHNRIETILAKSRTLYLKSHHGVNLQCSSDGGAVHCVNRNRLGWEALRLRRLDNGDYVLTSLRNGCNLQCRDNGTVAFDSQKENERERWMIEVLECSRDSRDDKGLKIEIGTLDDERGHKKIHTPFTSLEMLVPPHTHTKTHTNNDEDKSFESVEPDIPLSSNELRHKRRQHEQRQIEKLAMTESEGLLVGQTRRSLGKLVIGPADSTAAQAAAAAAQANKANQRAKEAKQVYRSVKKANDKYILKSPSNPNRQVLNAASRAADKADIEANVARSLARKAAKRVQKDMALHAAPKKHYALPRSPTNAPSFTCYNEVPSPFRTFDSIDGMFKLTIRGKREMRHIKDRLTGFAVGRAVRPRVDSSFQCSEPAIVLSMLHQSGKNLKAAGFQVLKVDNEEVVETGVGKEIVVSATEIKTTLFQCKREVAHKLLGTRQRNESTVFLIIPGHFPSDDGIPAEKGQGKRWGGGLGSVPLPNSQFTGNGSVELAVFYHSLRPEAVVLAPYKGPSGSTEPVRIERSLIATEVQDCDVGMSLLSGLSVESKDPRRARREERVRVIRSWLGTVTFPRVAFACLLSVALFVYRRKKSFYVWLKLALAKFKLLG